MQTVWPQALTRGRVRRKLGKFLAHPLQRRNRILSLLRCRLPSDTRQMAEELGAFQLFSSSGQAIHLFGPFLFEGFQQRAPVGCRGTVANRSQETNLNVQVPYLACALTQSA